MRNFLSLGRRRFAVGLFVIVGSLVLMGNQCAPKPTKPPAPTNPPAPTGLSIAPTSHDFGNDVTDDGFTLGNQVFTVTNNGPDTSGTLHVTKGLYNPDNFNIQPNTCEGATVAAGDTCTVKVYFEAHHDPGPRLATLIVSSDDPDDGTAVAELTGTATAS
jgi:hypothetical protein